MIELITMFLDIILHLDKYLGTFINQYGIWIYVLLFLIIFAETGLIITPFLPGDSLLFVAGALAAMGNMNIIILLIILYIAATLGNITNYFFGKIIGEKIITWKIPFVKKEYFDKTHLFFEKHGAKTIIFARFFPLFRTFVPFVAGAGKMNKKHFIIHSIIGCVAWVSIFLLGGFFFGNIPVIKENLHYAIIGIIVVSFIPAIIEIAKHKLGKKKEHKNIKVKTSITKQKSKKIKTKIKKQSKK